MKYIGKAMKRKDDYRLLKGQGSYIADIHPKGTLIAAFLRSPHAHAKVTEMNLDEARKLTGVVAIFGPDDAEDFPSLPLIFPNPNLTPVTQIPLNSIVHHVGEPVAMVIAENRYIAEDALDLIKVKYEKMESVAHLDDVVKKDAPLTHEHLDSNVAAKFTQSVGNAKEAMKEAEVVVKHKFKIGRVSCLPIETRGLLASWVTEGPETRLVVQAATQSQHEMRNILSDMFNISENQVRVIAPDVGGAFGAKAIFYVEDFLVPWASKKVGAPVKWLEDRMEHMQSCIHEREQYHEASLGLTKEGEIVSVYDEMHANNGAYVPWGVVVPIMTSTLIPGPYKVPNYQCDCTVYYTNTVPLAPFRGAGRPQAAMILNRLLDLAADKLGMDPMELKRKNLIEKHQFPYHTGLKSRDGSPQIYDSGDYQALLEKASELGEYKQWRKKQKKFRKEGRLIGIGVVPTIENTGYGTFEGSTIRVEGNGDVLVYTSAATQGQSHETTFAQVAADVFNISPDKIHVKQGDTSLISYGSGVFASRIGTIVGTAVYNASKKLKDKLLLLGSDILGVDVDDVEMKDGYVYVKENKQDTLLTHAKTNISFSELAYAGKGGVPGSTFNYSITPGLEVTEFYNPKAAAITSMADIAVVEVDPESLGIQILKYTSVQDNGTILNPTVVKGQIQGGISNGIGTAMYEEIVYDDEGQLLTSTLMDYLVPSATETPDMDIDHIETPSPLNPLGMKGAGESGTIPVPALIQAAVEDALLDSGVKLENIPVKPTELNKLITKAKENSEVVSNK